MTSDSLSHTAPPNIVIGNAKQRRTILLTVCLALMAVIASVSGLNVAQPELAIEFDASQSEVLWFINIYTLTLSALLLPLGALGDRWGRKPMLLVGLAVFGIASLMAAFATSSETMLLARFLSGVGAAMIMPVTLAVITSTFPTEERAKAIGVWTGVAGGGGILGMYLSAVLVDFASWRWLFALPVVLVILAGLMTLRSIPGSREVFTERFDTVGALTSMVAITSLVLLFHEGPERGWTSREALASLAIAVASLAGFLLWEHRHRAPLLDIQLFRDPRLASGSTSLMTVFGVQAGVFVVVFPFFQVVLGWSGLRSTLALMPMALLMMAAASLAALLVSRIGGRLTMATGIILGGVGLILLAIRSTADGGYVSVLPGMLVMGLGMGLTMTPATEAITSALPRDRQGTASALNDVTRELGTALGVALLGAVLSAGYRRTIDPQLEHIPTDVADTARQGIANAVAASQDANGYEDVLVHAARDSFVTAWHQAMWAGAAVMALLLVYLLLSGPRTTSPSDR